MTSGLIQYGVPTNDFLFGNSGETWAQNPKSDNFTCNENKSVSRNNKCNFFLVVKKLDNFTIISRRYYLHIHIMLHLKDG